MEKIEAIGELQANIGCIELDASNGRYISEREQAFIDAAKIGIEAIKRQIPKPVRVVEREYYTPQYFCPVCSKQQKASWKNLKNGCYCERCGQKLEAFR